MTNEELLRLPAGTPLIITGEDTIWDVGTVVMRMPHPCDDETISVFGDTEGNWDYLTTDAFTAPELRRADDVYRPVLEERKVGKVLVHLVDQGYPNALMELAKVLTWAGDAKGYKPHDWQNLPDAENSFQGAASRHRMKSLIQKAEGIAPLGRVDEESGLVHKVHELFNVMCELELMLTGKIQ